MTEGTLAIVRGFVDRVRIEVHFLLHVYISNTCTVNGVVFYEVVVLGNPNIRWTLLRRFSEFYELNARLETELGSPDCLPPFPGKSLPFLTDHFETMFVSQRRTLLSNYLWRLGKSPVYGRHDALLEFLTPNTYDTPVAADPKEFKIKTPIPKSPTRKSYNESYVVTSAAAGESDLYQQYLNASLGFESATEELTAVTVPAAQILRNDHVVYQVNVQNDRKRRTFSKWTVLKRFQEFFTLDTEIRECLFGRPEVLAKMPPLPTRSVKVIVNHLNTRFIEERRLLLDLYLKRIVSITEVASLPVTLDFLGCS